MEDLSLICVHRGKIGRHISNTAPIFWKQSVTVQYYVDGLFQDHFTGLDAWISSLCWEFHILIFQNEFLISLLFILIHWGHYLDFRCSLLLLFSSHVPKFGLIIMYLKHYLMLWDSSLLDELSKSPYYLELVKRVNKTQYGVTWFRLLTTSEWLFV